MPRLRRWLPAAAAAVLLAGCGEDSRQAATSEATAGAREAGGALGFALAQDPANLDPLVAPPEGQIVARQIFEPLVDRLSPPLGQGLSRRGLALAWESSRDRQVWRIQIRRGVRFQDGSRLDAAAVAANATRWRTTTAGRRVLAGLQTVDVPRPGVVRFVFSRAVAGLPQLLGSPRLGVVSPAAMRPRTGERARLARHTNAGSGPFELREWRRGRDLTLARFSRWWGTAQGLGPALDQIEFRIVPSARERLGLLAIGEVQVADALPPATVSEATLDPMLATIRGRGGRKVGIERSVRGLIGTAAESFSQVWLTRVTG
jgi:peptide/nickel transport system substrate-binding protein